jgi:hypothetical protein
LKWTDVQQRLEMADRKEQSRSLFVASGKGHPDVAEALIAAAADVNWRSPKDLAGPEGT